MLEFEHGYLIRLNHFHLPAMQASISCFEPQSCIQGIHSRAQGQGQRATLQVFEHFQVHGCAQWIAFAGSGFEFAQGVEQRYAVVQGGGHVKVEISTPAVQFSPGQPKGNGLEHLVHGQTSMLRERAIRAGEPKVRSKW